MAAAPENRYGSAAEFARALERAWLLVHLRRLLPAAAAAAVLLGAAAWLWPRSAPPPPVAAADLPKAPAPDAGPIEAEIAVTRYKDLGGRSPRMSAWYRSGRSGATPRGSRTWCGSESRSRGRRTAT